MVNQELTKEEEELINHIFGLFKLIISTAIWGFIFYIGYQVVQILNGNF